MTDSSTRIYENIISIFIFYYLNFLCSYYYLLFLEQRVAFPLLNITIIIRRHSLVLPVEHTVRFLITRRVTYKVDNDHRYRPNRDGGEEKLLIFAHRVPRLASAFLPLPRIDRIHVVDYFDFFFLFFLIIIVVLVLPHSPTVVRRLLFLSSSVARRSSVVIVPRVPSSLLPSRALPLRFTVFRSRAADHAGALTGHSAP